MAPRTFNIAWLHGLAIAMAALAVPLGFPQPIYALESGPEGPFPHPVRGALEVDPDSGLASLGFLLGPGIGRGDLRYVPALVGIPAFLEAAGRHPAIPGAAAEASVRWPRPAFEITPGSLRWTLPPDAPCASATHSVRWTYPCGSGGRLAGVCRRAVDPEDVLATFGIAGTSKPCLFPALESGQPGSFVLEGRAGELLIALDGAKGSWSPAPSPSGTVHGTLPARILVVRGGHGFDFCQSPGTATDEDHGSVHFRLAAVRAQGGASLSFTYGRNGVDFEAAWGQEKVRVTRQEDVPTGPDSRFPVGLEPGLRIIYEGLSQGVNPTVCSQASPAPGGPEAEIRIQSDAPDSLVRLVYGFPRSLGPDGPGAAEGHGPALLRTIELPRRRLDLEWEGPGVSTAGEGSSNGEESGQAWPFRIKEVREAGARTYRRTEGPAGDFLAPWVRESLHFANARNPETGNACRTLIRDRWTLRTDGDFQALDTAGEVPTLEWDAAELRLVPVAGVLTRRIPWEPARLAPPDPHLEGLRAGACKDGLRGGDPGRNPGLDQLQELAARTAQQAARVMAEQEARRAAHQAQLAAQIQAQAMERQRQAERARSQILRMEAAKLEEERRAAESRLQQQTEEARQKREELARKAEELERKAKELDRQAEEIRHVIEDLGL